MCAACQHQHDGYGDNNWAVNDDNNYDKPVWSTWVVDDDDEILGCP
jgi:hypothetical protein